MDANQQKHYESLAKAEADQRANFEALYKEIFNITEMPIKEPRPGHLNVYVDVKHQHAYRLFCKTTVTRRGMDGVQYVWNDIPLIQWLCAARFASQPRHEFVRNENKVHKWDILFHR